ncbi:MAG TPA: GNAT family N-acetyltransferase [Spirochaetota bacterium]|nr:GNAT family N-acetyltransferase [Spirochaetota bacterium]
MHLKMETNSTLSNNVILLKKLTMRYSKDFFEVFNDKQFSFYSTIPYPLKISWVKNYIKKSMEKFDLQEKYSWGIFRKTDEQFLGVAVLKNIDNENRTARLGYSVGRNFQNMGYTNMAGRLILDFAFNSLNLNRIEIRVDCADTKSIKLLDELKAVCEGKLRAAVYKNGKFYDLTLYSILRSDYNNNFGQRAKLLL